MAGHPKLAGIDLENSRILDVIYDDESVTLEMNFHLSPDHPRNDTGEGVMRTGFVRFADFDDLNIRKAQGAADMEPGKVQQAQVEGDYAYFLSDWGEIELTARSIQVALD